MFTPMTKRPSLLFLLIALAALLGALSIAAPGRAATADPITLPVGFRPEGIAVGRGSQFFVGSLGTFASENDPLIGGAIYRGDLINGRGAVLIEPQPNQMAVGLQVDRRTNYLFVAGGMFGDLRVYDAATGTLLARYAVDSEGGFINDLVVTRDAVYATNSWAPTLYKVPLAPGGKLIDGATGSALPLSGDYAPGDGDYPFQTNGIVATPDDKWLIIVNSDSGLLYRVDPTTGATKAIDLAGQVVNYGDGLVLDGTTIYVVQNYANQLSAVRLSAEWLRGTVTGVATTADFGFDIPTTTASFGSVLYVVNGRFTASEPLTPGSPDIEYALLRVPKAALR